MLRAIGLILGAGLLLAVLATPVPSRFAQSPDLQLVRGQVGQVSAGFASGQNVEWYSSAVLYDQPGRYVKWVSPRDPRGPAAIFVIDVR